MFYSFFWVIPAASECDVPTFRNTLFRLKGPIYEDGTGVPKRRNIKFRRQGNQPKERIENKEKSDGQLSEEMRYQTPYCTFPSPLGAEAQRWSWPPHS